MPLLTDSKNKFETQGDTENVTDLHFHNRGFSLLDLTTCLGSSLAYNVPNTT